MSNQAKSGKSKKVFRVLLEVDPMKTFCSGGGLEVQGADSVIPVLNSLKQHGGYNLIVICRDSHKKESEHFAVVKGVTPFSTGELYGVSQVFWPEHGIPTEPGLPSHRSPEEKAAVKDISADFHDDLDITGAVIIPKGMDPRVDSYSAFFDNGRRVSSELKAEHPFLGKSTGLSELIRAEAAEAGADEIHVDLAGITLPYCITFSAMDSCDEGFFTRVIADGCSSMGNKEEALEDLRKYGCIITDSASVLAEAAARAESK